MTNKMAKVMQVFFLHLYQWIYYGTWNSIVAHDIRLVFSCVISQKLPRSTNLPHPIGIVIGSDSPIGENCTILQNVTIGVRNLNDSTSPRIGNEVVIGAGAAVLGDIKVGDNAVIAANSVVLSDVPEGKVVGGVPAQLIE